MNSYVGIDIGGTKMYMMAETENGLIEHRVDTGMECTLEHILDEIEAYIATLPYKPCGVGIGVPGLVSGSSKVELSDVIPALNGMTAEAVAARVGSPVAFINDVKAATLGEAAYYEDHDTVAVIMTGIGIASGVVVKGDLLVGAKGWSGEMGYSLIVADGVPKRLDDLAGEYAILQQAGMDAATLHARLEAGEEKVVKLIRQAGEYFGLALINVVHLYNPDVIVIGGSVAKYNGFMEAAKETMEQYALPELLRCCTIAAARDMKQVVANGALQCIRKQVEA